MTDQIRQAYRDPQSGAVVIDDEEAYLQARNRKRLAEEKDNMQAEVSHLRAEMNNLRTMLETLMSKE